MNKSTIYSVIFITIMMCQCSDKERTNPLDPRNPDTSGKVTGVRIYSEFDTIVLSWNKVYVNDLLGYNVYRKTPEDSDFIAIERICHDSSVFYESNLEYDKRYTYRVSAVTIYFESVPSDSVSVIPGPTVVWISDVDLGHIKWISHDIMHEIGRKNTNGYPWDLVVSIPDRTIWYTDVSWGYVVRVNETWKTYMPEQPYWDPTDIALDEHKNLIWVANQRGSVIQIHALLEDSLREIVHEDFRRPRSLDIDRFSGIAWVADPDARAVFRISPYRASVTRLDETFVRPMKVVLNDVDGTIWVADSSRVVRLGTNERIESVIEGPFNFAFALDIDIEKETVWVVDFSLMGQESKIYKFSFDGIKEFELGGFNFPRNVIVNHYDHSCIVADSDAGEIIKIAEDGTIIGRNNDFLYPVGIFLEYERD